MIDGGKFFFFFIIIIESFRRKVVVSSPTRNTVYDCSMVRKITFLVQYLCFSVALK